MLRYIALSWNDNSEEQHRLCWHLERTLLSQPNSALHVIDAGFHLITFGTHPGLRVHLLPNAMGVVIGSLYSRPSSSSPSEPCACLQPDDEQATRILHSRGQWLVEHAWGSYVALLNSPKDRRRYVMTSPCGDLPCHWSRQHGVDLLFSDIQPLLRLQPLKFSINDHHLQSRLALGGLTDHPSLTQVQPILRGECRALDAAATAARCFHWHPIKVLQEAQRIEDTEHAAQRLRSTVVSCTHTLIAPHASTLLRLSGGLDSSIVAGCLSSRPQPRKLTSYTFCSDEGHSQELQWAESVVQRHGLTHRSLPVDVARVSLQGLMHLRPLIEPVPSLSYFMRSSLEQPLADEHQASAVFTGDGGDSGFCGESYAYALTDYLEHHGPGLRMFSLASRIAALTQQSTWTVLRRSLHRWRHGVGMQQHRQAMAPTLKLINPELLALSTEQASYPHPWFSGQDTVPWPLIRRLGMLISVPQPYDTACPDSAPEIIAPLYAQPVMEMLLSIPIHVHFLSGRERGLARHAFRADLPTEIAHRRWKDRPAGFLAGLMECNRKFLQELFLDGELVRRNLLDRNAVAAALEGGPSNSTSQPVEALRYLDYEFWLRAWRSA